MRRGFHRSILAATLMVLALMAVTPARHLYGQKQRIREEERRVAGLAAENAALERELARLRDPGYVETLARRDLGMVRPGETAYVVPDEEAPREAPRPERPPWWRRAWGRVLEALSPG